MTQPEDWMWMDANVTVGRAELARMCGISDAQVQELVDYGSLEASDGRFRTDMVFALKEGLRLQSLFDLDLFSAGLIAQYLHRIDHLEREVRMLRARVPVQPTERDGPALWHEPHA